MNKEKGITLIALVITIIILLILAGVTISLLLGNNAILNKAQNAKEEMIKGSIQEEITLVVVDIQTELLLNGQKMTHENLAQELPGKLYGITANANGTEIAGNYKGYEYIIDENFKVIIEGKIQGISISSSIEPKGYTNQNITLKIEANSSNGSITSLNGPEGLTQNADGSYTVTHNGKYSFTVIDSTGVIRVKEIEINTIDKIEPKDFTPYASNVTKQEFTIHANAQDGDATEEYANSGIEKYEYYVDNVKYESTQAEYKVTEVEEGKIYKVYVVAYDKAGNSKQSQMIPMGITDNVNIANRKSYEADGYDDRNVPQNAIDGSMTNGNGMNWLGGTKLLIEYHTTIPIKSVAVYTTNNWGYAFSEATIYYSEDDSLTLNSDLSTFKSIKVTTEARVNLLETIQAKRILLVKKTTEAVYEFEAYSKREYINFNLYNRKSYEADGYDGTNVPQNAIDGRLIAGNGNNWLGGTKLLVEYHSVSEIQAIAVYSTDNWGYAFSEATIYYSEDDSLTLNSDLSKFKSIKIDTEKLDILTEKIKAKRVLLTKNTNEAVYEFECVGKE